MGIWANDKHPLNCLMRVWQRCLKYAQRILTSCNHATRYYLIQCSAELVHDAPVCLSTCMCSWQWRASDRLAVGELSADNSSCSQVQPNHWSLDPEVLSATCQVFDFNMHGRHHGWMHVCVCLCVYARSGGGGVELHGLKQFVWQYDIFIHTWSLLVERELIYKHIHVGVNSTPTQSSTPSQISRWMLTYMLSYKCWLE